jgi:hypothetical protein
MVASLKSMIGNPTGRPRPSSLKIIHLRSSLINLCLLLSAATLRADPALTIYNQNFAVVRDTVPLDLKPGVNDVSFANTTAHLEPDSVILRDPAGKTTFQILEQNYRNDPVSQELLLSLFEGKTIGFLFKQTGKPDVIIQGKIIRSGYVPHSQEAVRRYGGDYASDQPDANQPIIEADGKILFGLPGQPLFPSLGDDTILKPALNWKIQTGTPAKLDAELAYVTGGMSWWADYNLAAPENGDVIDLVGWITMDNQTGKTFENAKIKLMAGNVNKIQPQNRFPGARMFAMDAAVNAAPPVTEKAFDEYHLYTVARPVTLHDRETKQVEFIHASSVKSPRVYVYDGARFNGAPWSNDLLAGMETQNIGSDFGAESDPKVAVFRDIRNSAENGLGVPLPAGRIRFYKQGDDQQLEFTGENTIDHTPKDETLHIYTGDAFDLVGGRKRTDFRVDQANHTADESFEIKLRNHKTLPVEIQVVEHLYRWTNWEITAKSDNFTKTNAQEIKFLLQLNPDEEKTVTYTVHYSW